MKIFKFLKSELKFKTCSKRASLHTRGKNKQEKTKIIKNMRNIFQKWIFQNTSYKPQKLEYFKNYHFKLLNRFLKQFLL